MALDNALRLDEKTYNAIYAVRSSILKHALKSAAHYKQALETPFEPSPAMVLGTAIHTMILEPTTFDIRFRVFEGDRRTKDGKAEYQAIVDQGLTPIGRDAFETARNCFQSVTKHPEASKYVVAGKEEHAFVWTDVDTGVLCKCKPDFLHNGQFVVDVKSTRDASLKGFQSAIGSYLYHVQAAFYLDGVAQVTGLPYRDFVFLCVETEAPYGVATYALDESSIEMGRALYKIALKNIRDAQIDNEWPAYPKNLQTISLPTWAHFNAQEIIQKES